VRDITIEAWIIDKRMIEWGDYWRHQLSKGRRKCPNAEFVIGNIRISMNISLIKIQLMKSSFMNVPCLRQKLRKT
tara:strand:+ start:656 stop:880 length:225 start_codon:yes stop_codon:yes gene_type:complete